MESITARRSAYYYWGILLYITFALIGFGVIIAFTWKIFIDYKSELLAIIFGAYVSTGLSCHALYLLLKKIVVFTITEKTVLIKDMSFSIQDITDISFSGKRRLGLNKLEGLKLTFKGNRTFYIYDCYYSNVAEIKSYLDNLWQHNDNIISDKFSHPNIEPEKDTFVFYKGSIINLNLLIVLSFFVFIAFMIFSNPYKEGIEIMLLLPTLLLVVLLNRFYYFGIGKHYLIIRSFGYLWIKRMYGLNEIKEILIESNGKAPHSMTIIMQDYT